MAEDRVYGAIAARMWMGDPGDSLLVAHSIGLTRPIKESELDMLVGQEQRGFLKALAMQVYEQTGLLYSYDGIEDRTEWLYGLATQENGLLEKVRRFVGGELEPGERSAVKEMGLTEIKRLADLWKRGVGRSLGG
jgi:hypothetical protein